VKRTLGKIALLAAIALLTSTAVYADTVTLASLGTAADAGQTNSSGNPTIAIDPNAAWSSALGTSSWVSFTTSGNTSASNYAQVANGTVTSFFDTFSLSGTPTSGSIEVMADDSTSVWLNGNLLVAEASTTNNTYSTCSDFAISCTGAYVINLPTDYLVTGNNVLQFDVAQRAGVSYGLDYYGTINTTAAVPEPSSIMLLGSGISAAFMRLRKKTK
jgi:PEP-CTERM motif-containing protein